MMTPEERALLNDQTIHGEGPARMVGNVPIADLTFRRRRYMGRVMSLMQADGATDSEMLYGWIAAMALPESTIKTALRSVSLWEDALDDFLEKNFRNTPASEYIDDALRIFLHDMESMKAASVEVEAKPGSQDRDAPPNS
jgi:hypothetical protein